MSSSLHPAHEHKHGPACGHPAIKHGDHVDYLHDGHLHHMQADGSVVEHVLPADSTNPSGCTSNGAGCGGHEISHVHGPNCGHAGVPHGDHVCYIVNGRLHYPHGNHCDDHGPVTLVS